VSTQRHNQLFAITKTDFHGFYTYYWIHTSATKDKALLFQDTLKYDTFNPTAENQMFRFQPVDNNNTLLNTFLIINTTSRKALATEGHRVGQSQQDRVGLH
jgi:hypothetical protein